MKKILILIMGLACASLFAVDTVMLNGSEHDGGAIPALEMPLYAAREYSAPDAVPLGELHLADPPGRVVFREIGTPPGKPAVIRQSIDRGGGAWHVQT